jgi:hypothetical protein
MIPPEIPPEPDQPDDLHGDHDPFVTAARVWADLEELRKEGFPEEYIAQVRTTLDDLMCRHRRVLVKQYMLSPLPAHQDPPALSRRLGLSHWEDGERLAANDPDRRST